MKNLKHACTALPLMIFAAVIMPSCSWERTDTVTGTDIAQDPVTPYTVTVDRALENMYDMMEILYGAGTRSSERAVASISTLKGSDFTPATRSQQNDIAVEDAVYVVNFADGEGFAVLGADNRIEPVIAITESGSITADDLLAAFAESHLPTGTIPDTLASAVVGEVIGRYIEDIIQRIKYPDDTESASYTYVTTYGNWTLASPSVAPLLTSRWRQGSPFNDNLREGWFTSDHIPSGCVTIALAQIIARNGFPDIGKFGIGNHTWQELREYDYYITEPENPVEDAQYRSDAAKFIETIYDGLDWTFSSVEWTAVPISCARDYLSRIGYSNVEKHNSYDLDRVKDMLHAGYPVFTVAFSDIFSGHAWVIDGYGLAERTVTTSYHYVVFDQHGQLVRDWYENIKHSTEYSTMVHCNWGWRGRCNGYYISGVFDLTGGPAVTGPCDVGGTEEVHFDSLYRTITYRI